MGWYNDGEGHLGPDGDCDGDGDVGSADGDGDGDVASADGVRPRRSPALL